MEKSCPLTAKRCGGCPLLGKPYPEQLAQKQEKIKTLLGRYAKVEPIVSMAQPWHYRNKAVATFTMLRGRLACGTYVVGSHRVLPAVDCLLQDETLNKTIAAVRTAAAHCHWEAFDEDQGTGLVRHVLVRSAHASGQVMVVLVVGQLRLPGSRNFVAELRRTAPWVTTIVQNYNARQTSVVLGQDAKILYGPGYITDTLCGLQFAISSRSFYQVNPVQTEKLYAKAIELAHLTGKETVLDAYCGIGTIGLCAAPKAKQVIGVERNPSGVKDAAANARRNKITNAKFICADATEWMSAAQADGLQPDVVFLDPPREGTTLDCIAALTKMRPARVVYISCNPETLARDLGIFDKCGYRATTLTPFDLFPHTEHIEVVIQMTFCGDKRK